MRLKALIKQGQTLFQVIQITITETKYEHDVGRIPNSPPLPSKEYSIIPEPKKKTTTTKQLLFNYRTIFEPHFALNCL